MDDLTGEKKARAIEEGVKRDKSYKDESSLHDRVFREAMEKHGEESREKQFAYGFEELLKRKSIRIDPQDPLAGFPFHYSYNTSVPVRGEEEFDTLLPGPLKMDNDRELREAKETLRLGEKSEEYRTLSVFITCVQDWVYKHWHNGHFIAGYQGLLDQGFGGILCRIQEKLRTVTDPAQKDTLEAFRIVTEAGIRYIERYGKEAEKMAKKTSDEKEKERLEKIAGACGWIAREKPRNFFEAVQLYWFGHELILSESVPSSVSLGRFDYYLTPYYERDIDAGTLTKKEAWDLVASFWTKCKANRKSYQNLVLGGIRQDGSCSVSELTYICLDVTKTLKYDQPSVCFRWTDNMPPDAWRRIASVIRTGTGFPALFNDKVCLELRKRSGISVKDAWNYAFAGCVEIGIPGKEYTITEMARLNLPKILELMLHQGNDPISGDQFPLAYLRTEEQILQIKSFEELFEWYLQEMEYYIRLGLTSANMLDSMYAERYPLPFLSILMEGCIDSGTDVAKGGAIYNNSGLNMCGIATVADSLAALKKLVFEKKIYTLLDFIRATDADFAGYEKLRTDALYHCPKYGNDQPEVDELAVRIAERFSAVTEQYQTPRGGTYRMGMYSVEDHSHMGKATGATCDGRKKGKALSNSMGAVQGMDTNGPTAMLNTLNRFDFSKATNGMVLDLKMTPVFLEKDDHIEKLGKLIQTYFERGGMEIQISAVSRQTLSDAQKHPEKYADLVVRVSGFSAYFTSLSKVTQDEIIERTEVS